MAKGKTILHWESPTDSDKAKKETRNNAIVVGLQSRPGEWARLPGEVESEVRSMAEALRFRGVRITQRTVGSRTSYWAMWPAEEE